MYLKLSIQSKLIKKFKLIKPLPYIPILVNCDTFTELVLVNVTMSTLNDTNKNKHTNLNTYW